MSLTGLVLKSPENTYTVKQLLGSGAFGSVYQAVQYHEAHDTHGNDVALKFISQTDPSVDASVLSMLSMSPHCNEYVSCMYEDFDAHVVYRDVNERFTILAMELIYGLSILEYFSTHSVAPREVMAIIIESLKGLMFIHEKGVAHGDIHAGNIIVTTQGRIKYIDFGLACNDDSIPCRENLVSLANAQSHDLVRLGFVLWMSLSKTRLNYTQALVRLTHGIGTQEKLTNWGGSSSLSMLRNTEIPLDGTTTTLIFKIIQLLVECWSTHCTAESILDFINENYVVE